MTVSLNGVHLVSLVGRQGSGKSFLGSKLAGLMDCAQVEVSDVVKSLNQGLSREELPATAKRTVENPDWLGEAVALSLWKKSEGKNVAVLTGTRELQLYKYLQREGAHIWAFEVFANPYLRCERLIRLGKVKDEVEFLAHEVRETKMGIRLVLDHARMRITTSDLTDPDELVKRTFEKLKEKGAKW